MKGSRTKHRDSDRLSQYLPLEASPMIQQFLKVPHILCSTGNVSSHHPYNMGTQTQHTSLGLDHQLVSFLSDRARESDQGWECLS